MLFDTHMHCEYSTDSEMKITEAIQAARAVGLGMTVTEHCDYDYPTNPEAFLFDVDDYFTKFNPYRSEQVLLGIEIGLQKQVVELNQKLITKYPFDEVIGSIHCMNGRDIYEPHTYEDMTKEQALEEYLLESLANIKLFSDFDILGHIDYICRYMPYDDSELYYEEFPELWDELFKLLIDKKKVLEINTRRLASDKAVMTLTVLYKRYKELGGTYVTIGSDAHYKEHVGRNFNLARKIAVDCQLQVVYFNNRKMIIAEE